jgi:adenylate cyclase
MAKNYSSKEDSDHKTKSFSIRTKLLGIISIVLVLSISLMIFLASHHFKKDVELRIRENDLHSTSMISLKIQSEFIAISRNLKILAGTFEGKESCFGETKNLFFENEKEILFLGIYNYTATGLELESFCINPNDLIKKFKSPSDFDTKATQTNTKAFLRAGNGATILENMSHIFESPVVAFSFPFLKTEEQTKILISYKRITNIAETFQTGMNTNFMVDDYGKLLVHPETDQIIQRKDMTHIPIVKSMLGSVTSNNQFTYIDPSSGEKMMGTFTKLGFTGGAVISTVPEDKVFQEVYNIQRRNLFLLISVLSGAVLIVFIFSKTITSPILSLVSGAKQIEKGNYSVYIKPSSGDEIGVLTESFNSMSKGLDEREKIKAAFGKFVNEEIAELSMKGEIKLGGERKYCAIFFSDIRSFTAISEKLEPEEVVEFLNQYMTEMVGCVRHTGGIVDKFIGDAIMATWGALKPLPNETESAINAAILMRKALIKFNRGRGGDKKPIIKIGCGINSGNVISGQIGSNERLEYTVIGDAVNLASRIETLTKPFGADILISGDAYERVKGIFKVENMPSIKVKGKEKPQVVYAILGRLDDPTCYENIKDLRDSLGITYEEEAFAASKTKGKSKPGEEVKYEFI